MATYGKGEIMWVPDEFILRFLENRELRVYRDNGLALVVLVRMERRRSLLFRRSV